MRPKSIVTIGAAGGGPIAINTIFEGMPRLQASFIVIQQMPKYINESFCKNLNDLTQMIVKTAENDEWLQDGIIYVAPSERHITLQNNRKIVLSDGEKVHWVCPSIDVLLKSMKAEAQLRFISVILTGLGQDGAEGIVHIKSINGINIVQNEDSCAIYGMPKYAMETEQVDYILPPEQIQAKLISLIEPG